MSQQLLLFRLGELHVMADMLFVTLLTVIVLECKISADIRDLAEGLSSSKAVRTVLYGIVFILIWEIGKSVVTAGFDAIQSRILGTGIEWRLSRQLAGTTAAMAVGLAQLLLFVICTNISERRWWAYYGVCMVILAFTPAGILYLSTAGTDREQDYVSLTQVAPDVAQTVGQLIARKALPLKTEQIEIGDTLSNGDHFNSEVVGLGSNRRVIVTRDLLSELTDGQLAFVIAHEIGHFMLDGVFAVIIILLVGLSTGFYLCAYFYRRIVIQWGARWSLRGEFDIAAYPVFFFLFTFALFLAQPLSNTYVRYRECRADRYALALMQGVVPDWRNVAVASTEKLAAVRQDDLEVSKIEEFWFRDHPTRDHEIELARTYNPPAYQNQ